MRILNDDYMNRTSPPAPPLNKGGEQDSQVPHAKGGFRGVSDLMYSRTLEALHTGAYSKFDAVFAGAAERISNGREVKHPDAIMTSAAREYSRAQENTWRDALIAETAHMYAQAVNTSSRDAVFAASRYEQIARTYDYKRREITCV